MNAVMDSIEFKPGRAKLVSYTPVPELHWRVIFEDEGDAAYCYACDGRLEKSGESFEPMVLDAMLVYNVAALRTADEKNQLDADRNRLATVEWSRNGQSAVLRVDGVPQVLMNFAERKSYCRSNFPNFMDNGHSPWRRDNHAWSDDAMQRFEAELYV